MSLRKAGRIEAQVFASDQLVAAGGVQFLDNLADVLGVVAMGDQQGVFGVDDDQILYANEGDKLLGAVDIVLCRVDGQVAASVQPPMCSITTTR